MHHGQIVGTTARTIITYNMHLLLVQTKRTAAAGEWELPGGKAKEDESPEQAAIREVREETGLEFKALTPLADADRKTPHHTYWRYVYFRGSLLKMVIAKPLDKVEILYANWFPATNLPPLTEEVIWMRGEFPSLLPF